MRRPPPSTSALNLYREFFRTPHITNSSQYDPKRSDGFPHGEFVAAGCVVYAIKDAYGTNTSGNYRDGRYNKPGRYRCYDVVSKNKDGKRKIEGRFLEIGSPEEKKYFEQAQQNGHFRIDIGNSDPNYFGHFFARVYAISDPLEHDFRMSPFLKMDLSEEDIAKIRAHGEATGSVRDFIWELFQARGAQPDRMLSAIGCTSQNNVRRDHDWHPRWDMP
ncbi:MAG: hypothetical protein ACPGRX_03090 [Bdellovibrionales bacterium]